MKILVINSGSSSIKFSVFELPSNQQIFKSQIDKILNIKSAIDKILDILKTNNLTNFEAIAHRVVHGGIEFSSPRIVNEEILKKLKTLIPLAPLHQPQNIEAIEIFSKFYPNIPQIACFDTAFHRSIKTEKQLFALPEKYENEGILRYGFHGISYEYITSILPKYAKEKASKRVIIAHLGNGASMCALTNLKSCATTMGFTPLDGLIMGTRCGNIDPGVILYLLQEKKMSAEEISNLLYKNSGLKGISNISNDIQDLILSKDPKAKKAISMFCDSAAKQLSALLPVIGGLDILVFTAGIGENCALIRKQICKQLLWLGIEIDDEANKKNQSKISTSKSKVDIYVIATNEEEIIAKHAFELIN